MADISQRFKTNGSKLASNNDASVQDVFDSLTYRKHGDESEWNNVLIVDDIYATGKTLGAVVAHLREAGLKEDVLVTVASPLRIIGKHQKK